MNVLQIIFSGLIIFVPKMDSTEMCVLLIDARHPLEDRDGDVILPHFPVIRAPLEFVKAGSRPLSWEVTDEDDVPFAVFLLDDEDLSLKAEGTVNTSFSLETGKRESNTRQPCCWDDNEPVCRELRTGDSRRCQAQPSYDYLTQKRDFSWLPDLDDAVSGAGKFKDDCFDTNSFEGAVVARLLIKVGEMYTYKLQGDERWWDQDPTKIPLVKFEGQHDDDATAIAREVALEIHYGANNPPKLTIESNKLYGTSTLEPVGLEGESGRLLKVWIENLPLQEIYQGLHGYTCEEGISKHHFEYFYEASEKDVDKPYRQRLTEIISAGDFLCPPVQGGG